jgi:hypothetical protein
MTMETTTNYGEYLWFTEHVHIYIDLQLTHKPRVRFRVQEAGSHTLVLLLSTFFVRVPPDIISLQLCTPKVVGT